MLPVHLPPRFDNARESVDVSVNFASDFAESRQRRISVVSQYSGEESSPVHRRRRKTIAINDTMEIIEHFANEDDETSDTYLQVRCSHH